MKNNTVLIITALISLIACQSNSDPATSVKDINDEVEDKTEVELPRPITRQDISLTDEEKQIAVQSNTFAFKLLKTVCDNEYAETNIFISPLSVIMALSMLDNGAEGATHSEIQASIGVEGISRETQNKCWQKIITAMKDLDTWSAFESVNSIWINHNFPIQSRFKEVNMQYLNAEIRNEDFTAPATLQLINEWVSQKTHSKISNILDKIDPAACLYLINTLYFNGYWNWNIHFDQKETSNETFYNHNGTMPSVPMMRTASTHLNYIKKEQFGMLEIPFGNEAFSMIILLPDNGISLSSVTEKLNGEVWSDCQTELSQSNVIAYLKLPRFKIEYDHTLNSDIQALGMKSMFKSGDFTPINKDLSVSLMKQKTFITVNEEGVEAAAATIVVMDGANGPDGVKPTPVEFTVNRPFLFLIKEYSTKNISFVGVVNNLHLTP